MASDAAVAVRVVDSLADGRWDAFVAAHPRASVYHLGAWRSILQRAYRFEPIDLALEGAGGRLEGLLPLAYKAGRVSGRRLTSLPVVSRGGPVAATPALEAALMRAGSALADERGAVLRVHSPVGTYGELVPTLTAMEHSPSWVLPLPSRAEELRSGWKRQGHLARNLRKAERADLTVHEATTADDLRAFYAVYLRTMKKHGAVPHGLRLFELLRDAMRPADVFQLLLVQHGDRVLAGGISLRWRDTVEVPFIAADDRYRALRPSYALHWAIIREAIHRGFREVNLGRTRDGSSQAAFKAQWGAQPCDAFEYIHPRGRGPLAPSRPARKLWHHVRASALWQRTPTQLTRAAGDVLYRYL